MTIKVSKSAQPDDLRSTVQTATRQLLAELGTATELVSAVSSTDTSSRAAQVLKTTGSHLDSRQQAELNRMLTEFGAAIKASATPNGKKRSNEVTVDTEDAEVGEVFTRFLMTAVRGVLRPDLKESAGRASLMLMLGAFETYVASFARALLHFGPSREVIDRAEISVREIRELPAIVDIEKYVVDRSVQNLMHGGIEDWAKWFERYQIDWKDVPSNWWSFREVDARRNLVAHADSKVSGIYLALASESGASTSPALGTKLDIDADYIAAADNQLSAFCVLLATSALLKLRPQEQEQTYVWATGLAEDALDEGRLDAAVDITTKLLQKSRNRLGRALGLRIQTLNWAARKACGNAEEVAREVSSHDFSGLDAKHAHIRAVLLDNDEAAVEQLLALIADGGITVARIKASTVYLDLRTRRGTDWLDEARVGKSALGAPSYTIGG